MLSRYNPNIEIRKGSRPPLNADHTHFIMVDDGYRNRCNIITILTIIIIITI